MDSYKQRILTIQNTGGNAKQRRMLRRYLDRVCLPMIDNGATVMDVCKATGIRGHVMHRHLFERKYQRPAWGYRRLAA